MREGISGIEEEACFSSYFDSLKEGAEVHIVL